MNLPSFFGDESLGQKVSFDHPNLFGCVKGVTSRLPGTSLSSGRKSQSKGLMN